MKITIDGKSLQRAVKKKTLLTLTTGDEEKERGGEGVANFHPKLRGTPFGTFSDDKKKITVRHKTTLESIHMRVT